MQSSSVRSISRLPALSPWGLALFVLAIPAAADPAQVPEGGFAVPTERLAAPMERLLVDQDEHGTIWVRGNDYKLSLDAKGAKFRVRVDPRQKAQVLELGAVQASLGGAPLAVAAEAQPILEDMGARYERGALVETWQFQSTGARQNFLLNEFPGAGDLLLRVPVLGELSAELDGQGLSFRAHDGAQVRYGDWLAFDARGRSLGGRPEVRDGAIEIELPAEFLAQAQYPLLIDPLLSSGAIHTSTHLIGVPDVAVDDSLGIIMVVFDDEFAKGDPDILGRRYQETGTFLSESPIDISDDYTTAPAVANHEALNQFLIAWENFVEIPYIPAFRLRGRTHAAGSSSMGTSFSINVGDGCHSVDLGGPSGTSLIAPYYAVWQELNVVTLTTGDVAGRTVSPDGSTGNKVMLDGRVSKQGNPAISKRAGTGNRWMVVYTTQVEDNVRRVDCAFVHGSGTVLEKQVPLPLQAEFDNPDVDGDGTEFLTALEWTQPNGNDDILGIRTTYGATLTHNAFDLSLLELNGTQLARDQFDVDVARTKSGFTYAYREGPGPGSASFTMFCATISGVNAPIPPFLEKRVTLSANPSVYSPAICNGLLDNKCFITWLRPALNQIELGIYQTP